MRILVPHRSRCHPQSALHDTIIRTEGLLVLSRQLCGTSFCSARPSADRKHKAREGPRGWARRFLASLRGRTIVYALARVRFEWHPPKAEANLRTHGVSFAEAVTVLEDDFALTHEDPDAAEEARIVTLGLSSQGDVLVVVYTYRTPTVIRLISAWKANKRQRTLDEEGRS